MNDNPFIVIEGIDKTGKSTIARIICELKNYRLYEYPNRTTPIGKILSTYLKGESYPFYDFNNQTKGQASGQILNEIHEEKENGEERKYKNELTPEVANLLFSANRYESANSIKNRNTGVVAARYKYSGFGTGRINNLDMTWVRACDDLLPKPTHIFFIDASFEEVKQRREHETERYEKEAKAILFHKYLKEECENAGAIVLEGGHSIEYYVNEIIKRLDD